MISLLSPSQELLKSQADGFDLGKKVPRQFRDEPNSDTVLLDIGLTLPPARSPYRKSRYRAKWIRKPYLMLHKSNPTGHGGAGGFSSDPEVVERMTAGDGVERKGRRGLRKNKHTVTARGHDISLPEELQEVVYRPLQRVKSASSRSASARRRKTFEPSVTFRWDSKDQQLGTKWGSNGIAVMDQMGINLQDLYLWRFIPVAKAEKALSLLPALIMHEKRAAQLAVLEKLDAKTCPLGANGAIGTLGSEMLQTTNWTAK